MLELQFEAEVGAHCRPALAYMFDRRQERRAVLFHVVSDNEGSGLNEEVLTREIPAPQ